MIPKKIHYCWLSNEKMSNTTIDCMATWRKILPEYEFILWDTKNFDINSVFFVKQAYDAGKYALAADYIRLYAIYNEGGIYLDTDVYMLKNFDDLLGYNFFSSLERDLTTVAPDSEYARLLKQNENADYINSDIKPYEPFGLQAAIFGANAGTPFIKDCMNWYESNNFLLPNGKSTIDIDLLAPDIYAAIAQNYGFKYILGFQQLKDNMVIFPADYFPNLAYKIDNAYALHLCENSWQKPGFLIKIYKSIKHNNFIRSIFKKRKYYDLETQIKMGGESKYYLSK